MAPEPVAFPMAENDPEFLKNNRSMPPLTWIGHSTLLLQFEGLNILTDPHLTRGASPVSFTGPEVTQQAPRWLGFPPKICSVKMAVP